MLSERKNANSASPMYRPPRIGSILIISFFTGRPSLALTKTCHPSHVCFQAMLEFFRREPLSPSHRAFRVGRGGLFLLLAWRRRFWNQDLQSQYLSQFSLQFCRHV